MSLAVRSPWVINCASAAGANLLTSWSLISELLGLSESSEMEEVGTGFVALGGLKLITSGIVLAKHRYDDGRESWITVSE